MHFADFHLYKRKKIWYTVSVVRKKRRILKIKSFEKKTRKSDFCRIFIYARFDMEKRGRTKFGLSLLLFLRDIAFLGKRGSDAYGVSLLPKR